MLTYVLLLFYVNLGSLDEKKQQLCIKIYICINLKSTMLLLWESV